MHPYHLLDRGPHKVCGPPVSTTSKIVHASYFPIPIHKHEILDPHNLEWESVKHHDMGQSSWLANQRYISLLIFLESTMYIYNSKLISLLFAHLESIVWVYRFKLILHYLKPKLHPFFHFFNMPLPILLLVDLLLGYQVPNWTENWKVERKRNQNSCCGFATHSSNNPPKGKEIDRFHNHPWYWALVHIHGIQTKACKSSWVETNVV